MIQLLTDRIPVPNSVVRDHRRVGLPTSEIVELYDCSEERAFSCVATAVTAGITDARARFHEERDFGNRPYREFVERAFRSGEISGLLSLMKRHEKEILSSPGLLLWHFWMVARSLVPMAIKDYVRKVLGRPRR
jgi:hypothetical protein